MLQAVVGQLTCSPLLALFTSKVVTVRGIHMQSKTDYSSKSFVVIGTHGEEDLERATMAFACANASLSLGIKTKVFLAADGVKLAQKGYAEKMPAVKGMASIKELIDAFVSSGGKIQICIPCHESRGIKKEDFVKGAQLINLVDFAAETVDADKVFTC